jgi:hypothetical protein
MEGDCRSLSILSTKVSLQERIEQNFGTLNDVILTSTYVWYLNGLETKLTAQAKQRMEIGPPKTGSNGTMPQI